ncbi:SH3 domain-containing protein [uncultured Maritimibacter sp.]|jgi:hypothetical protein|uniref:SH3 domain-containing protein n=1 Tax=uncultured Maritimibacter sp. TaxID=991866 RepID=UPI00262D41C9|nr:SH3 domain-containing protein [uncultured Maritimibacter sp.]
MALLRLTLVATAVLGAAMYHYGREDGLPDDPLGRDTALITPNLLGGPTLDATNEKESDVLLAAIASDSNPESPTQLSLVSFEPEETVEPMMSAKNPTADVVEGAIAATAADATTAKEPETTPMLYVSGSAVNVRGGPSTAFGVIDSLTYGTAVEDLGDAGQGWREIRLLASGETGYMSGQFLTATP